MPRAIGARLLGWAVPALRSNFALMSPGGSPLGLLERRELVQGRVMFDLRQGGRAGLDPQLGLALGSAHRPRRAIGHSGAAIVAVRAGGVRRVCSTTQ